MVKDVKKYIDIYLNYEPNIITFHIEAVKNEKQAIELINYIKSNNCKVGIAINPNTDISKIYNLLKYIHMVTIMTVEPGKGGQALIPETLNKIEKLYGDEGKIEKIDGLGITYNDWRMNLRRSNTEPYIRLNVESRGNKSLLKDKTQEILSIIKDCK